MKIQNGLFIAVLVISFFSIISGWKLFSPQFFTTHDGGGHIIRMEEFHLALSEGQFPVRIAKRINYGLGYPYYHFNYPLIYYFADVLHRVGLTFVQSFKAILLASAIVGSLAMYAFSRYFFCFVPSITVALFYLIVPYRFLNMYVRGALGEMVGLALLPCVLFSAEYLLRKKKIAVVPLIVSLSLLVLSHNITALIGGIVTGCYFLFRLLFIHEKQRVKYLLRFTIACIVSLLLTVWFWFPALYDTRLTKLAELSEDYKEFFPMLSELLYSPWGFGLWEEGVFPGKMSPRIGVFHLAMGAMAAGLLIFRATTNRMSDSIKPKKNRLLLQETDWTALFFLGIAFLCFFFSLSYSEFIWDRVGVLQSVQHPWRFVGYLVLCLSFLAGYVVHILPKKVMQYSVVVFLVFGLLYTNRNHVRVNMYIDYESPFTSNDVYHLSTTSKDEHMPLHAPRVYEKVPNKNGDILPEFAGESLRTEWRSNYHSFDVVATEPAIFRDNTSYFPGWVAAVDGRPVTIEHEADQFRRLTVEVPVGTHIVEFWFKEPQYRKIVNALSVTTLVVVASYVIVVMIRKKNI